MKCYEAAKANKSWTYLMHSYSIIVGQRMLNDNTSNMKQIIADFEKLSFPENQKGPATFLHLVTQGMKFYLDKDYSQAINVFKQARNMAKNMWTPVRSDLDCMVYIAKTFHSAAQPDSAIFYLNEIERIALQNGLTDYFSDIYPLLSRCYAEKGDKASADKYLLRHYEFRDSLSLHWPISQK